MEICKRRRLYISIMSTNSASLISFLNQYWMLGHQLIWWQRQRVQMLSIWIALEFLFLRQKKTFFETNLNCMRLGKLNIQMNMHLIKRSVTGPRTAHGEVMNFFLCMNANYRLTMWRWWSLRSELEIHLKRRNWRSHQAIVGMLMEHTTAQMGSAIERCNGLGVDGASQTSINSVIINTCQTLHRYSYSETFMLDGSRSSPAQRYWTMYHIVQLERFPSWSSRYNSTS